MGMVHFGGRLSRERYPPWATSYINYELLKEKLQDIRHVAPDAPPTVAEAKKHIFQGVFDDELKKVVVPHSLLPSHLFTTTAPDAVSYSLPSRNALKPPR